MKTYCYPHICFPEIPFTLVSSITAFSALWHIPLYNITSNMCEGLSKGDKVCT